jgi:ATP-dependent helicase/nuclease subunit B
VYEGLALQLLTYSLVATTFSIQWFREPIHIAGAVYFPVHFPLFPQEKPLHPSQIAENTLKKHKMRGLLLQDSSVVRAMDEQATSHSPLVEVRWTAKGTLSATQSKTVPPFYWDRLFAFVARKLQHLGQNIRSGCIEVSPYRLQKQTPCTFCAHASVCGFDPTQEGYAYREQRPHRDADMWSRIVQEGEDP